MYQVNVSLGVVKIFTGHKVTKGLLCIKFLKILNLLQKF